MTDRFPEPQDSLEIRLRKAGKEFSYPPTPDFAGREARRLRGDAGTARPRLRLGWVVGLLLALLGGLLITPPVRAQLVEFWQIGVVRIFSRIPDTPTPAAVTHTPAPTPTQQPSLLELSGHTTLEAARQQVDFPIRLPTYPAELGEPDAVFLQDFEGPMVVLIWAGEAASAASSPPVAYSLHIFGPDAIVAEKFPPQSIQQTQVHGEPALWTEGPYLLKLKNGDYILRRLVIGHVLIWEEDGITYRLESALPLEEAVQVAESLEELR
jgi:hypothetical protein